jgi:hypothetical protein
VRLPHRRGAWAVVAAGLAAAAAVALALIAGRSDQLARAAPSGPPATATGLLPFADRYARCQGMWYGSAERHRCLGPAIRELERRLARLRRANAPRDALIAVDVRLSMARAALREPVRPRPPRWRQGFHLSPAQVTRARSILAGSRVLAEMAGGQRVAIEDIGPYRRSGVGTIGAFAIVRWPRPVTLRDFAWPAVDGCKDGRPFRGERRVRIPLVEDLRQVAVTVDFRSGRVVSISRGPDDLGGGSAPPPPPVPDPSALVLDAGDLPWAVAPDPYRSRFGGLSEGTPASLSCALGAVGRYEGAAVLLRAGSDPAARDLVVSAAVVTESARAAARLARVARPLAAFMGFRPRPVATDRRVGDATWLYSAFARGSGANLSGLAVVWREGRLAGMVFVSGAGGGDAGSAVALAMAQEARMAAAGAG